MGENMPNSDGLPEYQPWYEGDDKALIDDAWYAVRIEKIKNGEPVWVPRNLDGGEYNGQVWDFFTAGMHTGMVDDEGDGTYSVFRINHGANDGYVLIGVVASIDQATQLLHTDIELDPLSD